MSRKDQLIDNLQHLAAAERAAGHGDETGDSRDFVFVEQADAVRQWAAILSCSEQELREAVETVGNSVDEVRRYLSHRKR